MPVTGSSSHTRYAYNVGVAVRIGLDARKLTDYGIGTYVEALAAELARGSDFDLVLAVRSGMEATADRCAPGAKVVPSSARGYGLRELYELPRLFRKHTVDLIHVPHYVLPPFMPAPTVATVHDLIPLLYPPQHRRRLALLYLRLMMGSTLRRARRVITVSRASKKDLCEVFNVDPSRIHVVHNGVDPALFERPDESRLETIKQRYGLRPPLLIVVGNDKPHKNVETAVRSFHRAVRRHRIPGQLVIVGGFSEQGPLGRMAARLGMEERIRFTGWVPDADLVALYHLASVLVHLSLYEGFGLPILEAMAAGLPVITANIGAMREVAAGSARLVHPLDVHEVADALERVLVDDSMRRRMIEAGRRRANELSWKRSAAETARVYRQVLGEG